MKWESIFFRFCAKKYIYFVINQLFPQHPGVLLNTVPHLSCPNHLAEKYFS